MTPPISPRGGSCPPRPLSRQETPAQRGEAGGPRRHGWEGDLGARAPRNPPTPRGAAGSLHPLSRPPKSEKAPGGRIRRAGIPASQEVGGGRVPAGPCATLDQPLGTRPGATPRVWQEGRLSSRTHTVTDTFAFHVTTGKLLAHARTRRRAPGSHTHTVNTRLRGPTGGTKGCRSLRPPAQVTSARAQGPNGSASSGWPVSLASWPGARPPRAGGS